MSPAINPTFSIVVVNYNGGDYVRDCIDSLRKQTFRDFEVIIVDNASEDGSVDNIDTTNLPNFQLLKQDENLGFAKANNLAAKIATGTWLALLNPDAVAAPNWLQQFLDCTERHPHVSTFASVQYCAEDNQILDGTGDAYLIFGLPWRGGFGRSVSELPEEGEVFSPCGAGALYRRSVFLKFGGFDERFFCYCEDVDLGFRMQLEGERCIFTPRARIDHAGSAISGRKSRFSMFHGHRNRTWTYFKNMPLILLILTLPAHIAIVSYFYIRNRNKFDHDGLKNGLRDGFQSALAIRRSTEFRTNRKPSSYLYLLRQMSWNPFKMTAHKPIVRRIRKHPSSTSNIVKETL